MKERAEQVARWLGVILAVVSATLLLSSDFGPARLAGAVIAIILLARAVLAVFRVSTPAPPTRVQILTWGEREHERPGQLRLRRIALSCLYLCAFSLLAALLFWNLRYALVSAAWLGMAALFGSWYVLIRQR